MSEENTQTVELDDDLEKIFHQARCASHREGREARQGARRALGRERGRAGRGGHGWAGWRWRLAKRRRRPPSTSS